jgi:hypothetical protein
MIEVDAHKKSGQFGVRRSSGSGDGALDEMIDCNFVRSKAPSPLRSAGAVQIFATANRQPARRI